MDTGRDRSDKEYGEETVARNLGTTLLICISLLHRGAQGEGQQLH